MFVIKDEQPFKVVEGSGYIDMMKEAQPRFKIPNRKKIAAGVWDLYVLKRSKLFEAMVVTAHFMDSEWKLHKQIINFIKITGHKGEDIGKVLKVCLNQWGIEKIFSITVDNASTNDVAIDYMKKRLGEMNSLLVGVKYIHMRCSCHILNLIIKSGLEEPAKSVEGIRNCVKYIHSSLARLDKFRDFAILFKMDKMSNVPFDVYLQGGMQHIKCLTLHTSLGRCFLGWRRRMCNFMIILKKWRWIQRRIWEREWGLWMRRIGRNH
ncbi:hypothetical protein FF1_018860 [Malus domestica]